MKNKKSFLGLIIALLLILSATGCTKTADQQAAPVTLTVSAAASLKDAMEEIQTNYAQEKSTITINYSFGGSGALQQQIENGADVDVFVSAATKQMDALADKGLLLDETRKNFLANQLVLVTPKGSDPISSINGLADEKLSG